MSDGARQPAYTIIGAGPVGALMALMLARRGLATGCVEFKLVNRDARSAEADAVRKTPSSSNPRRAN